MRKHSFWSPLEPQYNSYNREQSFGAAQSCQNNSDCPSAQGASCDTTTGQCMCGNIPACDICSSTPYCDSSDSSCFACHTDGGCNNPFYPICGYPKWDSCIQCQFPDDCKPFGNACDLYGTGMCQCEYGTAINACDPTSGYPTCDKQPNGNAGCRQCQKDKDCPSWRPKCINSDQDQYNTYNGVNYKGYCCPTGDPSSCYLPCKDTCDCRQDNVDTCKDGQCKCGKNAPCSESQYCQNGECVACLDDSECLGSCQNGECIGCLDDSECLGYCQNGECVGCLDDSNCTARCHSGACPYCQNGKCVSCRDDTDCPGNEYCQNGSCWASTR